jgi:hypothetical protein
MLRATPSLRAGEIYSVRASFNNVTVEDLRQAGSEYPDWVRARYLQLPATITLRTRQLAAQIAEGNETPYDITQAITQYLRRNYKYAETIPALPANQEAIDWFLFDLRTGFCNYYATAEIVLLRALGIPARLAVGYAVGVSTDTPELFNVRQLDAHAWPEVYFPGIGWVEFEPTASQPDIFRLQTVAESQEERDLTDLGENLGNLEPEPPLDRQTTGDPFDDEAAWRNRLSLIIAGALALILVAISIPLIRGKRLHTKLPLLPILVEKAMRRAGLKPPGFLQSMALMASLSPLERAYQQINLALMRIGKLPSPTNTPSERAEILTVRLPPTRQPAGVVLAEYHRAIYSPDNSTDESAAQKAGDEIRRISIRAKIRRRFGF